MNDQPDTHPVQLYNSNGGRVGSGRINTLVSMAAYEVYCHVFGPQPAKVEGSCRGGFSAGELIGFLYARSFPKSEWRARFDEALNGMKV